MDLYAIILIAIGLIVAIAFLRQFGILGGRGLLFAISGVALLFGFSLFQSYRRNKLEEEFKRREDELKDQEKKLREIEEAFEMSKEEVFAAEAALKSEKGKHRKRLADIDAEKEENIKDAKRRNSEKSISDLLEEF